MARGTLRIYLGAAPGVGKTFAMLGEGRRRAERGTDVVVGYVETHGRKMTAEQLGDLEVIPRAHVEYRGTSFEEMDVDAIIARRPEVALVDELAHSNVPGSRHEKRWEDVEALLDAGIIVISTLNVQHLESVNDVVEQITGVPQREKLPDEVLRGADQVELVDMSPDALRRRMAHGNVYPPEKVDAALSNYFRIGNLTALRELALLWLADEVDEDLDRYRTAHGIAGTWEARERVVVALTGGPEGDTLIRRASRIAARSKGADLLAVHVTRSDGLTDAAPANLDRQRSLVENLGGTYHQVVGDDVARALLDFAQGANATQLVVGASRRSRLGRLLGAGVGARTAALSGSIDVHMITHEEVGHATRALHRGALTTERQIAGFVLACVGLPVLSVALANLRGTFTLPSDILLFLMAVVSVALVGGLYPALFAAIVGFLLLNYYFTPPYYRFTIGDHENLLALGSYLLIAAAVSVVVDLASRRTREAARASADAQVLSTLAGSILRGESAPSAVLERLRETYNLTSVTLLERDTSAGLTPTTQRDRHAWRTVATVGGEPCFTPDEGEVDIPIGEELSLVLRGRTLRAEDRRVLEAFAAQAAVALRQRRLSEEAERIRPLAEADRTRTALLNAVSHDLRSPLASAKAAVEGLSSADVTWTPEQEAELLATATESLDRLDRLVANLLDMSRLQAGALALASQSVAVEDVIPLAVDDIGTPRGRVDIQVPEAVPEVLADPALLERVLANLIANALRYSPESEPVTVTASALGDRVEVRVIDRGPGIPEPDRDRVFLPFQRLGDRDNDTGVGLGLALSRGLAEAMGGSLEPEDTPGGGLTMTLTLRRSPEHQMGPAEPSLAPVEQSDRAGLANHAEEDVDLEEAVDPAFVERIGSWRDRMTRRSRD
jgi:two-component system sensor histidine kinase KdpD